MTPKLITIPTSHYCEKARWALDRARIAYVEEAHAPVFSRLRARRAGATRTVPVLIIDGDVLGDSSEILRWVDKRHPLYPGDATQLEERFDDVVGVAARVVAYAHLADDKELALRISVAGVPRWEAALARMFFGMARGMQRREYHITPANADKALADLQRSFGEVGARLADGRRYLAGDAFSAADLTFAALSGPVLLPDWPGTRLPRIGEVPAAFAAVVRELRALPAGAFALRLYAEDRATTA